MLGRTHQHWNQLCLVIIMSPVAVVRAGECAPCCEAVCYQLPQSWIVCVCVCVCVRVRVRVSCVRSMNILI